MIKRRYAKMHPDPLNKRGANLARKIRSFEFHLAEMIR